MTTATPDTLKEQGFRFMLHTADITTAKWVHPAEVTHYPDYKDVTDLDDEAFQRFLENTFRSVRVAVAFS